MLWLFKDLDITLRSHSHYARHPYLTSKPGSFTDSPLPPACPSFPDSPGGPAEPNNMLLRPSAPGDPGSPCSPFSPGTPSSPDSPWASVGVPLISALKFKCTNFARQHRRRRSRLVHLLHPRRLARPRHQDRLWRPQLHCCASPPASLVAP